MKGLHQVEQAYRQAFDDFAKKAQYVQTLMAKPQVDPEALEAALLDLECAHVTYDLYRDQWVQHLLPPATRSAKLKTPREVEDAHGDCVRAIAELLWENAGRPEGRSHEDWRKAEEIVKQAAAAVAA
jgi:DUF2934 family protein